MSIRPYALSWYYPYHPNTGAGIPYYQGWNAYWHGRSIKDCPYVFAKGKKGDECMFWRVGYSRARHKDSIRRREERMLGDYSIWPPKGKTSV